MTTIGAIASAVLLVLKLAGTIAASWLIVVAPLLAGIGIDLLLSLVGMGMLGFIFKKFM